MLDSVVRHASGEVVAGLLEPRENLGVVAEQIRHPLVAFAAHETVEIFKAHATRPLVERARGVDLIARRVVVLAKPRCGVAVNLQDGADGGVVRPMMESYPG